MRFVVSMISSPPLSHCLPFFFVFFSSFLSFIGRGSQIRWFPPPFPRFFLADKYVIPIFASDDCAVAKGRTRAEV
uniref:Putative secreted protein n=1 Tax=Anopheles darlingi TaxID=43151 RepID=A0A2M4DAQ1_ANODA